MKRDHEYWMRIALQEAEQALLEDEIPVGAVLVKDNELVFAEHNRTRQLQDPLAHAEKLIIDKILTSKIKYLYDYSLYVTLEPCTMCAGMMIWSRIGTVVYGAKDPKGGAAGSIYNVLRDKSFNHQPILLRGLLEEQCALLLQSFFREKRKR
ncbi:MAG: cytosine deaminase [Candidatus Cloacimonetes bacterium HGW-Cloacimonetes-2]|jgi:tRNA(adenine34) deaminase|nr:MAG: cytosine deaminase [Candidatus Cloacimonetes bacterium HGW-Cloacimonetes-2]